MIIVGFRATFEVKLSPLLLFRLANFAVAMERQVLAPERRGVVWGIGRPRGQGKGGQRRRAERRERRRRGVSRRREEGSGMAVMVMVPVV